METSPLDGSHTANIDTMCDVHIGRENMNGNYATFCKVTLKTGAFAQVPAVQKYHLETKIKSRSVTPLGEINFRNFKSQNACLNSAEDCTLQASLICIVTSLQSLLPRNQGLILGGSKIFLCFLQCPVSCPMGTGGYLPKYTSVNMRSSKLTSCF